MATILVYLWDGIYSNLWRTLVIIFVLANLKAVPLMWHVRLFSVLFNHLVRRKSQTISVHKHGASVLFEPVITTTSSPLLEIDFNLHKSNATFFTDLDINRIHLLSVLFKAVINPSLKPGPTKDGKLGGLVAALGGTSCSFRREIRPYQKYEIWSRVLCWDDKWLYIVSHFVKAGAVKPQSYRLPGCQSTTGKLGKSTENMNSRIGDKQSFSSPDAELKKKIFASAISKYVFKQGRKTIPVGKVLEELNLLPQNLDNTTLKDTVDSTMTQDARGGKEVSRDWNYVHQQNQRGLVLAKLFAGLDDLPETFSADSAAALGQFGDHLWN